MRDIDYALRDLGITMEQLELLTQAGEVLEYEINGVEKRPSEIHGLGIFATKQIGSWTMIGLGSIDFRYKTILGRYTNHSIHPNCMFMHLANNDAVMVSIKTIMQGDELLIDYRDHILTPRYLDNNHNVAFLD